MKKLIYISIILIIQTSCTQNKESVIKKPKPLTEEESSELYKTIAKMDSLYFSAQNTCDLEAYASFLAEDFEFFHDKGGLTSSKEKEMKSMAIFCGEEQRSTQPLRRQRTKGTLRVYPMDNYGALQFCDHTFHLQINENKEKVVGSGKMTALWKKENDSWKLARVISYDHQPSAEVELATETLNQYEGDYQFPDRVVTIEREGKLLRATDIVNGETGWTEELFPESENTFYLKVLNIQFKFVKEGSEITALNVYENGKLIEESNRK